MMLYLPRDRWPTAAGVATAVALVLFAALTDARGPAASAPGSLLGVGLEVWAVAAALLAGFLALQLVLSERLSLERERRLAHTAAALREAHAELERLAMTDPLTGVLNRRVFFERLGVEFRRSQRYGRALSVVMLDLDDFKPLNDEYGHPFGDYVIAKTAGVLASNIRESDVLARYGGEEFALLLPETPAEAALVVAEKLRAAVAECKFLQDRLPHGTPPVRTTLSAGVATLTLPSLITSTDLVERADRALYRAKREGKDRVALDPDSAAAGSAAS